MPYEKVGKNEPVCIADEVPFEIPESWEWVRIGTIFTLQAGKNIKASDIFESNFDGSYLCYGGNGVRGYVKSYNREGTYPIIGRQGALCGNIKYAKGKFYATEHAVCVETFAETNVKWACAFLEALNLNQYATATAQPGLAVANINTVLIPLPPKNEQQHIVNVLISLQPFIKTYTKKESELHSLNRQFSDLLKKSILQEAIQGKLVPQDTSDEPASVLLEHIRAEKERLIKEEKIKRNKHESVIYRRDNSHYEKLNGIERCIDDEIPFEIPDSWVWCRLKTVGITQTGNTPSKAHPEYIGDKIPFITPGDIQNGTVFYDKQALSMEGKMVARVCPKGSILQVCIGGSIGKAAITNKKVCFNQQINSISPIIICSEYIYTIMQSPYFLKNIKKQAGGTATPIINRGIWDSLLIPIAPISEQMCIVEKQRELFDKISLN